MLFSTRYTESGGAFGYFDSLFKALSELFPDQPLFQSMARIKQDAVPYAWL